MDSFFGIGAPEFILILVIAGMVMGPERIGRTARWLGRTTAQLQGISRSFIRQLNAELDVDGEKNELQGAWRDMQDLRRQIDDLKGELTAVTGGAFAEGQKSLADIKKEVERTIAPPSLISADPKSSKSPAEDSEMAGEGSETAAVSETPSVTSLPMKLPKRVDIADDPEE